MINILVTLNSNYIDPLTIMLRSLMDSNTFEHFSLYVAHSSLTAEDFTKINANVDRSRTKVYSVTVPAQLLNDAPVLKRISKETYYRLLAVDYLPQSLDRILYIDPDTIILNSLSEFYNLEFGDKLIAGATHVYSFIRRYNLRRLGMPKNGEYINAGVLMMNLDGLRRSYTVKQIFDFITKNADKLPLADQDVINALYGDKTIALNPAVINCDEKTRRLRRLTPWQIRMNTVIVHYDGKYKPWKPDYKGKMKCFYDEYAEDCYAMESRGLHSAV